MRYLVSASLSRFRRENNLPYEIWPFSGRSDYGPFIASDVNIPGMKLASNA